MFLMICRVGKILIKGQRILLFYSYLRAYGQTRMLKQQGKVFLNSKYQRKQAINQFLSPQTIPKHRGTLESSKPITKPTSLFLFAELVQNIYAYSRNTCTSTTTDQPHFSQFCIMAGVHKKQLLFRFQFAFLYSLLSETAGLLQPDFFYLFCFDIWIYFDIALNCRHRNYLLLPRICKSLTSEIDTRNLCAINSVAYTQEMPMSISILIAYYLIYESQSLAHCFLEFLFLYDFWNYLLSSNELVFTALFVAINTYDHSFYIFTPIQFIQTQMNPQPPLKQYPRNQIYSNPQQPPIPSFPSSNQNSSYNQPQPQPQQSPNRSSPQNPQTINNQKSIVNISGTSLAELTYSPKSSKNSNPELAILHQRIEYLQKQLQMLTQLLMEEEARKMAGEGLERQNTQLRENLQKVQEINALLQKQLSKSEKNNEQLTNALQALNNQYQQLKSQIESRRDQQNISDSKNSKSREQVQQDIIKLNQQISTVLSKLHTLNQDYETLRQTNNIIETHNKQLSLKISELEQKLSLSLKQSDQYKQECEYMKEQIQLLKEEIQQVNQMSIQKQKNIYEEYALKEKQLQQEVGVLRREVEESRNRQKNDRESKEKRRQQDDNSTLIEIKNVKIRALEIDKQMLRRQIQNKQEQLRSTNTKLQQTQRQVQQKSRIIQKHAEQARTKFQNLEQSSNTRITLLEQHIRDLKNMQQKSLSIQNQYYKVQQQLNRKQQRIFQLESQLRSNSHKDYHIRELQEEVRVLKAREFDKDSQIFNIGLRRNQMENQVQQLRGKLARVQAEVRNAGEVRDRYAMQMDGLKQKMRQLVQLSQQQEKHIRDIENEHENSRKKIEDISVMETTHIHKLDSLQSTNKELQKMVINQKVQKENQNKRYRQLLEDYKQLNHELTIELNLYRDAKSIDHPHCPLKDSADVSIIANKYNSPKIQHQSTYYQRHERQRSAKKQLEKQKNRYQKLLGQHEKTLERYKGIQSRISQLEKIQKEGQFLKIDNSSMRAQITQLNIRIEEYKGIVESMRKQVDGKSMDAQKLRYAMQRQYQGKLQLQRMQIINEYNSLLRNRSVHIQPSQQKQSGIGQLLKMPTPVPQADTDASTWSQRIKYHPQFKKLQQEYIKLHRQFLEMQQAYNKQLIQYKDQIKKLRIQNQYHRKTIDQLQADSYGIQLGREPDMQGRDSDAEVYKNKYEQINDRYHKLYQEYMQYKSKNTSSTNTRILQLLRPQQQSSQAFLSTLSHIISQKLAQFEITPREPSSTLQRAAWLIEKLSELIVQLRKDREILRNQKKQVSKQNDKLKVTVETLEYQKSYNIKQLTVAVQKLKYLEEKHLQLSELPSTEKKYGVGREDEGIISNKKNNFMETQEKSRGKFGYPYGQTFGSPSHQSSPNSNTNEKDVHRHQANVIRQQRLSLLRKYQKDMELLDEQMQ